MKKDLFIDTIIPIILWFSLCFTIAIFSYNIGYKGGQKDALFGKYKYQITDTIPKYIIKLK
jgi:hypothetical protein